MPKSPIRIVILVGTHGRGSNMMNLIDACREGEIPGQVVGVISPSSESPALLRAASAGVATLVVPAGDRHSERLLEGIQSFDPDLITLAGYMKRLDEAIVGKYPGRIMNIHPALIPSFCGKGMYGHHVHEAVLEAGVRYSGCTVHFVDEGYDTGPIILQTVVPVEQDDTPDTLAARVLQQEHATYRQAVKLFAEGRLQIVGHRVRILPA